MLSRELNPVRATPKQIMANIAAMPTLNFAVIIKNGSWYLIC